MYAQAWVDQHQEGKYAQNLCFACNSDEYKHSTAVNSDRELNIYVYSDM